MAAQDRTRVSESLVLVTFDKVAKSLGFTVQYSVDRVIIVHRAFPY
jgi:hypothetical protein